MVQSLTGSSQTMVPSDSLGFLAVVLYQPRQRFLDQTFRQVVLVRGNIASVERHLITRDHLRLPYELVSKGQSQEEWLRNVTLLAHIRCTSSLERGELTGENYIDMHTYQGDV